MKRELARYVAVAGLLLSLPGLNQGTFAQALRAPTVDDRFRDTDNNGPEAELPSLIPPQVQQVQPARNQAAAPRTGPAYLGVTFSAENDEPVVIGVKPGGPADQAGLKPNDWIETLQGLRVQTNQDVLDIVAKMRPGDLIDIGYSRRMSMRTQAALDGSPTATPRSAGYPPDAQELLPAPTNTRRDITASPSPQVNRYRAPQRPSEASSAPRRYENQNNRQEENNRRLLDRGFRRR